MINSPPESGRITENVMEFHQLLPNGISPRECFFRGTLKWIRTSTSSKWRCSWRKRRMDLRNSSVINSSNRFRHSLTPFQFVGSACEADMEGFHVQIVGGSIIHKFINLFHHWISNHHEVAETMPNVLSLARFARTGWKGGFAKTPSTSSTATSIGSSRLFQRVQ